MKTYLIYQKSGRAIRVQAATIGLVRDGVVVLHNAEGQATAVFPVAEMAGIVEETTVQGETAEPKTKGKASAKTEG
jgi:hypothetical protein